MKKLFTTAILMAMAVCSCTGQTESNPSVETEYWENVTVDGMNFNTEDVTTEFEYDECGAVSYTNHDMNLDECPIYLTWKAYAAVTTAIKTGRHFKGQLKQSGTFTDGAGIYDIVPAVD